MGRRSDVSVLTALAEIGSGPALLRTACERAKAKLGVTYAEIARETFGVSGSTLSGWLSGAYNPENLARRIAWIWARIPIEAWDTAEEREIFNRVRPLAQSERDRRAA